MLAAMHQTDVATEHDTTEEENADETQHQSELPGLWTMKSSGRLCSSGLKTNQPGFRVGVGSHGE